MAIIEQIEPGVHRFSPIQINMGRGGNSSKLYYLLVVGQHLDSFSPEQSCHLSWRSDGDYYRRYEERKADMARLAFSKKVFADAHLWRERRFLQFLTCLSDELQAEITKSGLRVPKHYRTREV